ncbi:hypothetical protein [Deinococcus multiflagellatus]|uniref:Lipoprotein n=1 Tax=Deinococcus multiflagellatus TaxID=1656887 RepID=A0ABW1ZH73_9DEIO|nr:hypothetical protein [Deinococcus multiflagellatus]MBZ9713635.1 hypothetical protein [Deinococcus multiflagellatus]
MPRLLFLAAATALLLAACQAPPSTDPAPTPDPFAGLPAPVATAPAQGNFAAQTTATVRLGPATLQSGAVATYLHLDQGAGGALSGYALFRGLDGQERFERLSGTNAGGRVTLPLSVEACGATFDVTLYGTVAPASTLNVAGGSRTVSCHGVPVTVALAPFQVKLAGGTQ